MNPGIKTDYEQPRLNAGGDTFPLDVAATWTDHRRTLTAAVDPTNMDESVKLEITGAALSGHDASWRLTSAEAGGDNLDISNFPIDSIVDSLTIPRLT